MYSLYGALLLTLPALALPQNPKDPAPTLNLDEVATQLGSIESQTLQDTGTLAALARSNIVGQDPQLAAGNAALMTKLGEVHQLAQTETAALTEAKNLAINNVGATVHARTTIQDASGYAEPCALLPSQSSVYEQVEANAFKIAQSGSGSVLFLTLSTPFLQSFKCPGSSSEICGMVANLSSLLQATGKQIVQVARSDVRTIDNGRHQIIIVGLDRVADVIIKGAAAVQTSLAALKTSLQCSEG